MSVRPRVQRVLRVAVLLVGLLLLVKWQWGFTSAQSFVDDRYRVTASTGINREPRFVFFLRHLGLFPIATDAKIKADTKAEALRILKEEPKSLVQDEGTTFRSGDRGRTFLYLVDTWLRKSTYEPSIRPAHAIAFTGALSALFIAFWAMRKTAQGALLCLLLGSNSFQLFAVYRQENVFSWSITAMILVLALNVALMRDRRLPAWYPVAAAVATGLSLALIRNVRSEPMPLLLSALLVYSTAKALSRFQRATIIGAMLLTFVVTSWGSVRYLDKKLARSKTAVERAGGAPYAGPVVAYHEVWHVLFCGLGDYDTEKGYVWDDRVAFAYAFPELKKRHPELALDPHQAIQSWNYDTTGKYPVLFFEVPGYHDIIRDKVLGDIRSNPRWYLGIIKKRLWKVLTETTPVGIASHDEPYQMSGALIGLACVPLLIFLLVAKRWFMVKLLLFSMPLSIAPLAIYSDGGMTNYSTYHIFGVFILGLLVGEGCWAWLFARKYGGSRASVMHDAALP